MMLYWSFIFFLIWNIQHLNCLCTFPVTGTWETSDHGILTFSNTTVDNFPSLSFGTLEYTCDTNTGDRYMATSPTFNLHGVDFEVYICLRFVYLSENKYQYYLASVKNPSTSNERLKSAALNAPLGLTDVCDRTDYSVGSYSMMLKKGSVLSELEECPAEARGNWSYTYKDIHGASICQSNSSLDACSQNTTFTFDYSRCSNDIMFSTDGNLHCLFSIHITPSSYYTTLYNADSATNENTTFRFSCIYMELLSADSIQLTQYPQHCHSQQTATSVPPPGVSLTLSFQKVSISTLPPSNESTSSTKEIPSPTKHTSEAYIALGVIAPIVLFIITGGICFCIWKMYQRKLENTKPKPDPKFVHGEIRNRRLNVQYEGALQAESKQTRKNISHQTGNGFHSSTIPSDMSDDSNTRPSSLTSLLISVPRTHTKEECVENQSFNFQESVKELTDNESTSSQIKDSFGDPEFNTIGVDTTDLRRTMKTKTETKKTLRKKFRLRRSRSSVRDSLLTPRSLKNDSRISSRKPLKSIVSYGTKTVVLGIQPPNRQQKKLLRRSHEKTSFLDKISEEPSSTYEKSKKHNKEAVKDKGIKPLKETMGKNPEVLSGGFRMERQETANKQQYPDIFFNSYCSGDDNFYSSKTK